MNIQKKKKIICVSRQDRYNEHYFMLWKNTGENRLVF